MSFDSIAAVLRSPRARAGMFLLGSWALFFLPHLLSSEVPFYRDQLLTIIPLRDYLHERLRSGHLPQWYPFEGLGVPFIGQVVAASFHPQSLLFLPFDAPTAVKLNTLLAYLFGAGGAQLFARRAGASRTGALASAMAFGFGGYALGMSNNLVYLMGHCTLPWVGWAALRAFQRGDAGACAWLALLWASIFLAGDAQMFALAPLLMVAAVIVTGPSRRRLVLALGALAMGSLLICVELLPALAVSASSLRELGTASTRIGLERALHPLRIFELVIPGFIPDAFRYRVVGEAFDGDTAVWSTTIFAGSLALFFAVAGVASRKRAALTFAAIAVLGLLLSLGDRGGLLPVLAHVLPIFSKFRYPEKYLALVWTGLVPVIALGVDAARGAPRRWPTFALAGAALFLVGAGVVAGTPLVASLWSLRGHPLQPGDPLRAALTSTWTTGLATSAAFLLLGALTLHVVDRRPALRGLLPVLLFAEVFNGNHAHLPLVDAGLMEASTPFADAVRASRPAPEPPPRVVPLTGVSVPNAVTFVGDRWVRTMRTSLRPDDAGRAGVGSLGFNLPAMSLRAGLLFGPGARRARVVGPLFNACFRVSPLGSPLNVSERVLLVSEEDAAELVEHPCLPRAFLAAAQPVPDEFAAAAAVERGLPARTIVWERGPSLPPGEGTVVWTAYEPESLGLTVNARAQTALFVGDQFARGWTAQVDGADTRIYAANVAGRGIVIPAGTHQVTFTYRTPNLFAGALLSMLGLAAVLSCLVVRRATGITTARASAR